MKNFVLGSLLLFLLNILGCGVLNNESKKLVSVKRVTNDDTTVLSEITYDDFGFVRSANGGTRSNEFDDEGRILNIVLESGERTNISIKYHDNALSEVEYNTSVISNFGSFNFRDLYFDIIDSSGLIVSYKLNSFTDGELTQEEIVKYVYEGSKLSSKTKWTKREGWNEFHKETTLYKCDEKINPYYRLIYNHGLFSDLWVSKHNFLEVKTPRDELKYEYEYSNDDLPSKRAELDAQSRFLLYEYEVIKHDN